MFFDKSYQLEKNELLKGNVLKVQPFYHTLLHSDFIWICVDFIMFTRHNNYFIIID